jgi:phosphoribosyl-ATP pyrophosphohydrolase
MDVREIKELAKKFSPEQIEGCIGQELETGANVCLRDESSEKVVNELAKAQFVRALVEKGVPLADALRELARRMRQVQQGINK